MMTQDSTDPFGDVDDLLEALQEVEKELEAVSGDFEARITLRERQRELKAAAARLRHATRTPAELARELDQLKRLREEIVAGHMSVGHVGGGNGPGGGGMEPRDVFAMNEAIDKAWGRAELERRIESLQARLGEPEETDDEPPGRPSS